MVFEHKNIIFWQTFKKYNPENFLLTIFFRAAIFVKVLKRKFYLELFTVNKNGSLIIFHRTKRFQNFFKIQFFFFIFVSLDLSQRRSGTFHEFSRIPKRHPMSLFQKLSEFLKIQASVSFVGRSTFSKSLKRRVDKPRIWVFPKFIYVSWEIGLRNINKLLFPVSYRTLFRETWKLIFFMHLKTIIIHAKAVELGMWSKSRLIDTHLFEISENHSYQNS